jgi:Cu/Zn superoxide dismutase
VGRHPNGSCANSRVTVSRGDALAAASAAPVVGFDDPAGEHGTVRFEELIGDLQAQVVQADERGQVRAPCATITASRATTPALRLHG